MKSLQGSWNHVCGLALRVWGSQGAAKGASRGAVSSWALAGSPAIPLHLPVFPAPFLTSQKALSLSQLSLIIFLALPQLPDPPSSWERDTRELGTYSCPWEGTFSGAPLCTREPGGERRLHISGTTSAAAPTETALWVLCRPSSLPSPSSSRETGALLEVPSLGRPAVAGRQRAGVPGLFAMT